MTLLLRSGIYLILVKLSFCLKLTGVFDEKQTRSQTIHTEDIMDATHEEKVAQLRAILNTDNGQADFHVLESVNWDVQVS